MALLTFLGQTLSTVSAVQATALPVAMETRLNVSSQVNPSSSTADEISWNMAGGNPQRTSWVPEGVNPAASSSFGLKWYRPIEAYIGQHVQLITARDKVYVSTARGLYALDANTGDEIWRFDTELPLGNSPTVVNGKLFVAGFDRRVYALNADTGQLIWKFEGANGGFSTNPLVVEGMVLLGSRDGYFYALDESTGNLNWQYPAANQSSLAPILYSAAHAAGKVYFAANDNFAYALNIADGTLQWRSAKMPGDGYQAWWPVIYRGYVLFSAANPYLDTASPGAASIRQVVDQGSEYYSLMHDFQFGTDVTNALQRDDIFHQGETNNALIGPTFLSGSAGDPTAKVWDWANGATTVDGSKLTEYLEDDGQVRVDRPTNKPWRRSVIVLNASDGSEFTFDSDQDQNPEYAPFSYVGTKSGNRYPPITIPTTNSSGAVNDLLYSQNMYQHRTGWEIPRAKLMGWQLGTQYLLPVGGDFALDEPFANSAGGSFLYTNLCCDRNATWNNVSTNAGGELWGYSRTLESIKTAYDQTPSWQKSLAPGYDVMWNGASMYASNSRLWGSYGTTNGIYHSHGLQNPIIPYKGKLFVHRSNAILAFGPNSVTLRSRNANETPEEYELNIAQEYPTISRPLLTIGDGLKQPSLLTIQEVRNRLDQQISQMLEVGHLRPGYYNAFRNTVDLANYYENPGDTLYTLVQAYPYVSASLKPQLEMYIEQHYQMYFGSDMYARTGYRLTNPSNYDLTHVAKFGQLQPREWMDVPPEISKSMAQFQPSLWMSVGWPWQYPQNSFYALWKYAQTFYSNDSLKLGQIYAAAKSRLDTNLPSDDLLVDKPWVHNALIAGYTGFLNLQQLAGKADTDKALRDDVQSKIGILLERRSQNFATDHPWTTLDFNRRSLNVARNFMYLTPEVADYLANTSYTKVESAIHEYESVAPYWVGSRYEASYGELASDNLYTHAAMFQAKALILKEPLGQLLKYVDMPAFARGDLFYIQELSTVLGAYSSKVQRINAPRFQGEIPVDQTAIAWLGEVDATSNYADIRVGYSDTSLKVIVHVLDRQLWYDETPVAGDLENWDAVTLYLNLGGNSGEVPPSTSHRFVAQLLHWQEPQKYQTAYTGNGSTWVSASTPFTTSTFWRGEGLNDGAEARGWSATFDIPFASIGLSAPPAANTTWGMAVAVHDRDDSKSTAIPPQTWPASMDAQRPSTWSQLAFGLPSYQRPTMPVEGVTQVRQGLNGATVKDGHVGGSTTCGQPYNPDFFNGWGSANYAAADQINIQNQYDVADWPCFSKYYATFPLESVPGNKAIISATLTLYQFGNGGQGWDPGPQPSLLQVLTVADAWDESTLTWNNAPEAMQNIAAAWAYPLSSVPDAPGVPVKWDVSQAVANAYWQGEPLRLALYSADDDYHSGKYFWSSNAADWNAAGRPTLEITWGDVASEPPPPTQQAKVSVRDVTVTSGGEFDAVIEITQVDTNRPLHGVELHLMYDAAVLNALECTALGNSFDLTLCNTNTPGKISLSAVSGQGSSQDVQLARLHFRAVSNAGQSSALELQLTTYADKDGVPLPVQAQNGQVNIVEVSHGDVSCDSAIDVIDALFVLQYDVALRGSADQCPLPQDTMFLPACDVDADSSCNVVDALFVLQCSTSIENSFCPAMATSTQYGYRSMLSPDSSTAATIAIPNVDAQSGEELTIPILSSISDSTIGAATVEVLYDPNLLEPLGCQSDPNGQFSQSSCNIHYEADGKDTDSVRISLIAAAGVTGEVPLANVNFRVIGKSGESATLQGIPSVWTVNGTPMTIDTQSGEVRIIDVIGQSPFNEIFLPMLSR